MSTYAGEGEQILYIARERRNHFVPLRRNHEAAGSMPYPW